MVVFESLPAAAFLAFGHAVDAAACDPSEAAQQAALHALGVACQHQSLVSLVLAELLHRGVRTMQRSHLARFWSGVSAAEAAGAGDQLETSLLQALQDLSRAVESYSRLLDLAQRNVCRETPSLALQQRLQLLSLQCQYVRSASALLMQPDAPVSLADVLHRYFEHKLQSLRSAVENRTSLLDGISGAGTAAGLMGPSWVNRLLGISGSLQLLGLEAMCEEVYAAVVCNHLRDHLVQRTQRTFDEHILSSALEYSTTVPLQFLDLLLSQQAAGGQRLQQWQARLGYYVYETVGTLRILEMFDMVVEFPDSLPALEDVRACLKNTSLHQKFIALFGKAMQDRLLHPGAATTDIIQQYVSTIKALHYIDPSGVILDAIGDPIRDYLRSRKDTTRCIVTMLTDDGEDSGAQSLLTELGNTGLAKLKNDNDFEGAEADSLAAREFELWEPDPVEAGQLRTARSHQSKDVISMLVGIYGSKELFINEYRSMLAKRLLIKGDYNCDRELRTLELLKVRFGESNLHNAEVMLKDLTDSKRTDANVKSVPNNATPLKKRAKLVTIEDLSATIISQLFWPQLPAEEFTLLPEVQSMLQTYGFKYHSLKAPRELQWKPNLGTVSLEVTIGTDCLEFNVNPLCATVLLHFRTSVDWPANKLADALGISVETLRRAAIFWINQGVLSEVKADDGSILYHRNEQLQRAAAPADAAMQQMDASASGALEEDEMAQYETFILGMLTNFDALPLDRIHNMLKMFASDPGYDKPLEVLATFMSKLVADEKVMLDGTTYKKRE